MHELVYCDDYDDYWELRKSVEKHFPDAVIKDASDCVHRDRFSVEGEMSEDDFFKWSIREGCFLQLLGGQLMVSRDVERVKGLVAEVKREMPE